MHSFCQAVCNFLYYHEILADFSLKSGIWCFFTCSLPCIFLLDMDFLQCFHWAFDFIAVQKGYNVLPSGWLNLGGGGNLRVLWHLKSICPSLKEQITVWTGPIESACSLPCTVSGTQASPCYLEARVFLLMAVHRGLECLIAEGPLRGRGGSLPESTESALLLPDRMLCSCPYYSFPGNSLGTSFLFPEVELKCHLWSLEATLNLWALCGKILPGLEGYRKGGRKGQEHQTRTAYSSKTEDVGSVVSVIYRNSK